MDIRTDQLKQEELDRVNSDSDFDISHLIDGLKEERLKGITMDVAYRFMRSKSFRYIVVDCPGHEELLGNLLTGAAQADAAIVLVDANHKIKEQTYRQILLLKTLGIKKLLICINKMDLASYAESVFEQKVQDLREATNSFELVDFVAISALRGDNFSKPSKNLPWSSMTFLEGLEGLFKERETAAEALFAIQSKTSSGDYLGKLISGSIKVGQDLGDAKILKIFKGKDPVESAETGLSLRLRLKVLAPLKRGAYLSSSSELKVLSGQASLFWLARTIEDDIPYIIQGLASSSEVKLKSSRELIDWQTHQFEKTDERFTQNSFGKVTFDSIEKDFSRRPYEESKDLGSFLLIHPKTFETLAAGFWES